MSKSWNLGLVALLSLTACATIDPGDDVHSPFVNLDEDTFYCEIQPNVIAAHGCAEVGCHVDQSAMLLMPTATPAECADGVLQGPVPPEYRYNFENARSFVQGDPLSSTFYTAPTALTAHEERVFDTDSPPAGLIRDWILAGTGL